MAPDRSRESSIPEIDIKSKDSSVAAEYTNDTFESIDSTITRSHSTPVRVTSSPKTPSIKSISRRSSKYEENKSEEDASTTGECFYLYKHNFEHFFLGLCAHVCVQGYQS